MKTFAEVKNNIVVNVIIADDDFISSQENPSSFVEYDAGNVAYIGGEYIDGVFISPQPFPSWSLDANYDWQAPIDYPADGKNYSWDESNQVWVELPAS